LAVNRLGRKETCSSANGFTTQLLGVAAAAARAVVAGSLVPFSLRPAWPDVEPSPDSRQHTGRPPSEKLTTGDPVGVGRPTSFVADSMG
jgi:hypothetical protein